MSGLRIFFTGVGGQGTLTATILLARAAMLQGLDVVTGEVHGMAQRGGVVESALLMGGFKSPRIAHGEADILLGFEPLETLRALPYLKKGGTVISSLDPVLPIGVTMGRESYPALEVVQEKTAACAKQSFFLPSQSLGLQAGALQCGNLAVLGALCSVYTLPFGKEDLEQAIKSSMRPHLVEMNLHAVRLGAEAVQKS